MSTPNAQGGPLDGLIATLHEYLVTKAPFQLPDGAKEFLVRFGPWISLVLLVLTLPVLLLALGIGTFFVPFAGLTYASGFGLSALLALVQIGLLVLALPGLFARKMAGWTLMFYQELISIVASLLSGAIIGGLFWGVVGLYLLFQVREKYTA